MDANLKTAMTSSREPRASSTRLGTVEGFADEWTELCKLYDAVKAHSHMLDHRRMELQR